MKVQITQVGKAEFDRVDVIKILNEWLQKNKGYTAKSMIFETKDQTLSRVICTIENVKGDDIADPYHEELQRREYKDGFTRPNYGFSEEMNAFLQDLSKLQSGSKTVIFNYGDAKKHFLAEFPKMTEETLKKYLLRGDMHEVAKITILQDGPNYIGTIL